jgi:hypothetical protein
VSKKSAKVISRDAFTKAFIQAELVMRHNLAARMEAAMEKETNEDIKTGLRMGIEIVYGRASDE